LPGSLIISFIFWGLVLGFGVYGSKGWIGVDGGGPSFLWLVLDEYSVGIIPINFMMGSSQTIFYFFSIFSL
tara:strand:- start:260 stop:472 length:213 start_codon:yes stop_codon:yes gene_type:complete